MESSHAGVIPRKKRFSFAWSGEGEGVDLMNVQSSYTSILGDICLWVGVP